MLPITLKQPTTTRHSPTSTRRKRHWEATLWTIRGSLRLIDSVALAYTHQGNFGRAIELFARCKKYYANNARLLDLATLQSDIGYVFADLGNYEFSLKNYFEALAIAEANNYEYEKTKLLFRLPGSTTSLGRRNSRTNFLNAQ